MNLEDIQSEQKTLLEANEYLSGAGVQVVLSDGTKHDTLQSNLADPGAVIMVGVPTDASVKSQAGKQIELQVSNTVLLMVNPATNPDGANIDVMRAVREIVRAVLGWDRSNGEIFWQLSEQAFDLLEADDGLWVFGINFEREIGVFQP